MRFRIVDESTSVGNALQYGGPMTDQLKADMAGALTIQLCRDTGAHWDGNFIVSAEPITKVPLVADEVVCSIPDLLPDQNANAVAYHDVNGAEVPVIWVAREECTSIITGSDSISGALSHEAIETVIDPYCNEWCDGQDGFEYAKEGCDAVQETGYLINGIYVSNFVTPKFFAPRSSGPYDYLGKLTAPFETMSGGYQLRRLMGTNETQVRGKMSRRKIKRWSYGHSRLNRRELMNINPAR